MSHRWKFHKLIGSALLAVSVASRTAGGADLWLSSGIETAEWVETLGTNSTTTVTFKFWGLEVKALRCSTNWMENPMLLRPQLLIWRCPPLSSPSTVHLELLADNERAKGEGLWVSPVDPRVAVEHYANTREWIPLTNSPSANPMAIAGYQKIKSAASSTNELYREEIHILSTNQLGFRLRLVLSPNLAPADEAAIRETIARLSFQFPRPKRQAASAGK